MGRVVTSYSHPVFDLTTANLVDLVPCSAHCPFPAFSLWYAERACPLVELFPAWLAFPQHLNVVFRRSRVEGASFPRSCRASCFAIAGDAVMGPSFPALPLFNKRILCSAAPLTSGFHFFSAADAVCSVVNQCLETSLQAALPVNKDPINSGSTQSLTLPEIPVTSYCPQEEKIIQKMKPEKT